MARFKIVQERGKCIGCGTCAALCPSNWEMAADGKSRPKKNRIKQHWLQPAGSCPVKCIKIIKQKEKK